MADADITLLREIRFPHSLGMLYSTFTAYLGFAVNEDEYKVMGLAAYGRPTMTEQVRKVDPAHAGRRVRARAGILRVSDDGRARSVFVEIRRSVRAAAPSRTIPSTSRRPKASASPIAPPACSGCSRTRSWTSRRSCVARRGCPICVSAAASRSTAWRTRGSSPRPASNACSFRPRRAMQAARWERRSTRTAIYFRNPDRDVPDHPFWGPPVDAAELARAAREDGQDVEELDETVR